ncbi:MAG: class I adenylate cyclase, partial [Proteobacteria bacterium]|nr:class I adenylate cyclase [Pseudomonadota bacterium]
GGPVGLEKRGLVKRLFSEKKQDLAEVLEMVHSPKEKSLPGSEFSGAVTSRSLTKLDLTGSYFTKAQFIKATFSAVVFSQSAFIEVDFTGCTFNNCTFSESLFRSTTFTACDFKNCEFTDAAFDDCAMTEGKVERCFFTGAVLRATHFSALRLRFSSFNLCQLQESFFTSVLFEASALTHCQFIDCALDGCEMDSCEMAHSTFLSSNLTSSMLVRSNLGDCTFIGSSSDNGAFEQARMDDLLTRASTLEMKPASPPGMASSVPDFLLAITDQWSRRLNILRYHAPMLRNNQRRLEHSARRMAGEDCFWLVPYLLHTDLIDQKLKLGAAPPCRLEGYTPSFRALSIAAVILKDLAPTPPTAPPLVIQGLYAMGSIGSVAQTRASDVDYWVCYDPASATPKKLEGLRVKLAAITDWAMETYELEVYFFLMSMDDVRRNEFGFSDKESSGSAQAILLKEEFYRTVVPVAGMHPAWWVTPSGVSEAAHRKWLAAARTLPTPEAPRFVDMGHLSPIPADEFFGAALWQIVKALHSPYKSVMKLGLLEKYSSQPKVLMMADQIKSNLVNRQREVERIDPYVVLFRELRDYYRNANEGETVKLLTEALLLKAKVGEFDFFFGFPSIFEEHSLLEFLFGKGKVTENKVRSLGQDWSFAKSMQIGKTVSHFMTATYKRIQGSLVTGGTATKARITPEDRTRLGRQISANFARKKNKIVRVPFLGVKGYPELHFLADKSPGKPTVWAVQGLTPSEGKKSVKDTEPLFRAENPGTLLAWLVMNRLFAPKTLVDGESSIAPMSAVDIKNALAQLHAFFHYDTTFELPPDDYLGSERVTMALLLINLAQQPELNTVASVDVIYATSWGEVFCVSVPKPGVQIKKNVRSWLAATLPHDASTPTRLKAFYPKRSQCPRLPGI